MNRGSARALRLEDYAEAVPLRIPYRRAQPLGVHERPAVVRELVDRLLADDMSRESRPRTSAGEFDDPRSMLRALLTVCPPAPLPESFHAAFDRLLEGSCMIEGSLRHPFFTL